MEHMVACMALEKRYGAKEALCGLNLNIEPGRIVGLLGPNGRGKTTFMKLANGLLTPSSGEMLLFGKPPGEATKSRVAFLPEHTSIPLWMKVSQLLEFYEDFFGDFSRKMAEEMLDGLGVDLGQRIKELSKGNREKVQLVATMSRQAGLYLLDEPIAGVDPATRDYILRTIVQSRNPEAGVIISTHLIQDIEPILDDVIFLQQGVLRLQGTADEVRAQYGMSVDALFREEFRC